MSAINIRTLLFGLMLLMGGQAQALLLSPGGEYTNELFYSAYSNPDAADVSAIVGASVDLLYKDNVGGVEEGIVNFMASYDTTYFNTPDDPSDALLEYQGGDVMTGASWLLVKDGNQAPSWYLFDILSWDGIEDIEMLGFWPDQGAISHISVFGDSSSVPEPSVIALISLGLAGIGFTRRKISN